LGLVSFLWLAQFAPEEYRRARPRGGGTGKSLSCMLGRHSWTTRVDHGEIYEVCSACGKDRGAIRDDPLATTDDVARRVRAEDKMARTLGADRGFGDDP